MADKPRNSGRPSGPRAGQERGARPGERPRREGRPAGKPERGPAPSRKQVGGVDLTALERLEQEGLLTKEGRQLRQNAGGGAPARTGRTVRTPRSEAGFGGGVGGYASVDEQLARSLTRGPRFGGRRARLDDIDDEFAERPARTADRRTPSRRSAEGPEVKPQRGPRPEGPVRRDRPERFDRSERPARAGRPERPERGDRAAASGGRRTAPKPAAGRRKQTAAEREVAERLQKVMARAGVASRRSSEELIQAGRVTVNGRVVTELGTKVVAGKDVVEIDGRPLGKPESQVYLLLNKPKGYVTTLYDPQGRPKVVDLLGSDVAERVYPVGRLDYDTEGLLLLTNDGELANALMHPAKQVKKTYIAKVRGVPGPGKLRALETGIELEDGVTAPAEVKMIEVRAPNAATLSIRIHEGRNRQVRRMFEAVGNEVIHLKRTTLGPLHLKDLALGQWRHLTAQEVRDLYAAAGLRMKAQTGPKGR